MEKISRVRFSFLWSPFLGQILQMIHSWQIYRIHYNGHCIWSTHTQSNNNDNWSDIRKKTQQQQARRYEERSDKKTSIKSTHRQWQHKLKENMIKRVYVVVSVNTTTKSLMKNETSTHIHMQERMQTQRMNTFSVQWLKFCVFVSRCVYALVWVTKLKAIFSVLLSLSIIFRLLIQFSIYFLGHYSCCAQRKIRNMVNLITKHKHKHKHMHTHREIPRYRL